MLHVLSLCYLCVCLQNELENKALAATQSQSDCGQMTVELEELKSQLAASEATLLSQQIGNDDADARVSQLPANWRVQLISNKHISYSKVLLFNTFIPNDIIVWLQTSGLEKQLAAKTSEISSLNDKSSQLENQILKFQNQLESAGSVTTQTVSIVNAIS